MNSVAFVRALRMTARIVVFLVALIWFSFAAMSGAGPGIEGFLMNLPNTLPWLGLFALFFVAVRWELVGGLLVLAVGLTAFVFFNAWNVPIVFVGVCLPLILAGAGLIMSHWLDRRRRTT